MRLILFAAMMLLFAPPAFAQSSPGLTKLLDGELSRFAGPGGPYHTGIYVKHMTTGETASVRGDDRFDSASTIKLVAMVMAYQMQDQHKLNLADRYTIKASDMRGGSGIFRYHDLGLNPTLRDVITEMVITSDNSATDIMIGKVGGKDAINAWLKQNGYQTLQLKNTIYTVFRRRYELIDPKYAALTPEDVFALMGGPPAFTEPRRDMIKRVNDEGAAKDVNGLQFKRRTNEDDWLAVVSPNEIGKLLEGIEGDTIASKAACEEMKRIMLAQQAGQRKIPHFLSVRVAHKTGETGGVTNDVGMIYAKSGPIIVSFYTGLYTGLAAEADDRLGQVARLIVEYFDGKG
jgi:beta-lactamase class A